MAFGRVMRIRSDLGRLQLLLATICVLCVQICRAQFFGVTPGNAGDRYSSVFSLKGIADYRVLRTAYDINAGVWQSKILVFDEHLQLTKTILLPRHMNVATCEPTWF